MSREYSSVRGGGSDAVYGLGVIGAAVYYLQQATSVWSGVYGLIKAILWPAFMIFHLLSSLKM